MEFYRLHFKEMQRDISAVGSLIKIDELRWRSNWFYLMGYMLEQYYNRRGGFTMDTVKGWHC